MTSTHSTQSSPLAGKLAVATFAITSIAATILLVSSLLMLSNTVKNMDKVSQAQPGPSPVQKILNEVSLYADATVAAGGPVELVRFDESTSAFVPKCPLTADEQATFGHLECPEMSVDELRATGYVEVGKANYTWCDDSVLDFTVLSQINDLHVEDGVYKDADGYIACYSRINPQYDVIETPLGPGKVYDCGGDWLTIGLFLSAGK